MTATEQPRPKLFTRLAAAMHGEVAATTVEAYRRAGASAYQDLPGRAAGVHHPHGEGVVAGQCGQGRLRVRTQMAGGRGDHRHFGCAGADRRALAPMSHAASLAMPPRRSLTGP